jgi:formylglycine-generating enzyme required for sulfatase activity
MNREPEAAELEKVEAEEFDRLQAENRARNVALEQEADAEREEQSRREVLERVWREQEDYAHAVSGIRDAGRRRRLLGIAAAGVVAAAVIAAVLYSQWPEPGDFGNISEADALRIASEARIRREEEVRTKIAAEAAARLSEARPEVKPESIEDPAARRRAEEAAKLAAADKAAAEKTKALALKAKEEERRSAEAAARAQAQAMVQAEERARTVASVKEAPRAAQRPAPGAVFQDCAECPRMVVIPAGEFVMGSPAAEAERAVDEGPQRQVTIAQPFALGRSEVTVAEFRRFVEESGYRTEAERDTRAQGCSGFIYADPAARDPAQPFTSWRSPGLAQAQADPHPVLCVSWNDARAYTQWLTKKTGRRYRLPTESEWEYAARAGSAGARPWGEDPAQACRFANVADQSRFQTWSFGQKHDCTDGHYFTAPAGGYAPNRFGLFDMLGNVWEWTEDCWNASYAGAPADGSAWLKGDCGQRILRGGSWSTVPRFARSAARHKNAADHRDNVTGFRVARALE